MIRACKHCGNDFDRKGNNHYCSVECGGTHKKSTVREQRNEKTRAYRARRYREEGRWADSGPKAVAAKAWMTEIKSHPCMDCGKCFPICCMDFDHRPNETKAYNIGAMFAHHYSRKLIEIEIAKCDLVCANCHRIRIRDRRNGSGFAHKEITNAKVIP